MTSLFKQAVDKEADAENFDAPGVRREPDGGLVITSPVGPEAWTDEALAAEHGIDLSKEIITKRVINRYGNNKQYKFETKPTDASVAARVKELLNVPDPQPWVSPTPRPKSLGGKPKLIMVTSDLQIPFHDAELHELTCRVANDIKADAWYDLGDEFDLPGLSRWQQRKPRYTGDTDFSGELPQTIEMGKKVFSERNDALPDYAEKHIVDSNHLERWDTYILQNAKPLFGVVPHIRELCFLPQHGWKVHLSDYGTGTYQMAEVEIAPGLLGIHGYEAKGQTMAGQSIMQELKSHVGYSMMQGHCNHLAKVFLTRGGAGEYREVVTGFEVGMMGQYNMPFGSRKGKDWQKGFVIVTLFADGSWNGDLVEYNNRAVIYRDNKWEAPTVRAYR